MGVRIDKWLWASRFFKTRSLAKSAIEQGKIKLNGQKCKPSRAVELNDKLVIKKAGQIFEINVTGLSEKRGSATIARELYTETEESIKQREEQAAMNRINYVTAPKPFTKPSKKDRRDINKLKRSSSEEH